MTIIIYIGLFIIPFGIGMLEEWLIHYYILHYHAPKLCKIWPFPWIIHQHSLHHKLNLPDTIYENYKTYVWFTAPFIWVGFLYNIIGGTIFATGALLFVLWLAIVHRQAHLVIVSDDDLNKYKYHDHMVHHNNNSYNFGVTTHIIDRLFGTYKGY